VNVAEAADRKRAATDKKATDGKRTRVTLIPGDGIGPEVIAAAVEVVEATGVPIEWDRQRAGREALLEEGTPIPDALIRSIRRTRVALKGPLATHVGHGFRSVNVALRKTFDLYANLRPIRTIPGVKSLYSGIDLVVVRENTEDLYSGIEHQISPGVVESVKVITARASTRIAEFAFRYATARGRQKVTAIHKANIMKLSDGLFLDCARKVAKRFPSIAYDEMIVDNACMQLVLKPHQFDVLLLENLYGDIVSDLCAGLVGGLGVTPAANLGRGAAIFEAVHGTAPDIAGKNLANPLAVILSAAMMLEHLGHPDAGQRIVVAVDHLTRQRSGRTKDLGGSAGTDRIASALIALMEKEAAPSVDLPPSRVGREQRGRDTAGVARKGVGIRQLARRRASTGAR
jgi:isocitrate dehydrogenase (NAD+)